jgi:coproporphyrinogen III oxidase-like Fe-S oxidoreductase
VQSLAPAVLRFLDRTHDPANVERAVAMTRDAGFETFNLDLIYGTPGESVAEWRTTLEGVLALEPPHVSAYGLTVEAGTPLDQRVRAGTAAAPDDDDQAAKYAVADSVLSSAGLAWYEVSNWARPGHECRHNLVYWTGGDYLPIGCAAHGHDDGRRWWNVRTPERYLERIAAGADPVADHEVLDAATRAEERFALGVRTRAGAPVPPGAEEEAARLVAEGLLERSGGRVVLTAAGRPLGSDLTTRLLALARWDQAPVGTR